MRYGSDLDLVFLYGERRREHDGRRPPRVVRARVAAVDLRDGDDAGGGAAVQGRHAPAAVGRAGAAGDVVERVRALPPRRGGRVGAGGAAARARRLQQRGAGAARAARGAAAADRVRPPVRPASASSPSCAGCARASRRERGRVPAGSRHLRFDPGGIMDVEFLVALGQLDHAADPGVRDDDHGPRAGRAWSRSAGRTSLRDDYAALRRATLRLRLLLDRPEDVVSPRDLPMLARSLGTTPEALGRRPRRTHGPRPRRLRRTLPGKAPIPSPACGVRGSRVRSRARH